MRWDFDSIIRAGTAFGVTFFYLTIRIVFSFFFSVGGIISSMLKGEYWLNRASLAAFKSSSACSVSHVSYLSSLLAALATSTSRASSLSAWSAPKPSFGWAKLHSISSSCSETDAFDSNDDYVVCLLERNMWKGKSSSSSSLKLLVSCTARILAIGAFIGILFPSRGWHYSVKKSSFVLQQMFPIPSDNHLTNLWETLFEINYK